MPRRPLPRVGLLGPRPQRKEFLESLDDGREVWIYGERVKNITAHPAFQNCARMLARLYDALHEDHRTGRNVLTMPTDWGGFTHRYFRAPTTVEEQVAARDAIAALVPVRAGARAVRAPDQGDGDHGGARLPGGRGEHRRGDRLRNMIWGLSDAMAKTGDPWTGGCILPGMEPAAAYQVLAPEAYVQIKNLIEKRVASGSSS